jgi:hypothetical protein
MLNRSTLIYIAFGAILFTVLGKIAASYNNEEYYLLSGVRDGVVGMGMFGILMYTVPSLFPEFTVKLPSALLKGGSYGGDYDLQVGVQPR